MSGVLELAYVPLAESEHVYLNGVEQQAAVDYTIDENVVIYSGATASGDRLEARYAHEGVTVALATIPTDTFDRPDDASDQPNTPSDGGVFWQEGDVGGVGFPFFGVLRGRCYLAGLVGGNVPYRVRPTTPGRQVVTVTHHRDSLAGYDWILVGCARSGVGPNTPLDGGYMVTTDANTFVGLRRIVSGVVSGLLTSVPLPVPSWVYGNASLEVTYNPTSNRVTCKVNGVLAFSYADVTPPTTGQWVGFGTAIGNGVWFDDFGTPQFLVDDFYSAADTPLAGRPFPTHPAWTWADWPDATSGGHTTTSGSYAICAFTSSMSVVDVGATSYTIKAGVYGDGTGLLLRAIDTNNYWRWRYQYPSSSQILEKKVAGAWTTVATTTPDTLLSAVVTPTTIALYAAGVQVASISDATHATGTKVGIFGSLPPGGNYGSTEYFGVRL